MRCIYFVKTVLYKINFAPFLNNFTIRSQALSFIVQRSKNIDNFVKGGEREWEGNEGEILIERVMETSDAREIPKNSQQ